MYLSKFQDHMLGEECAYAYRCPKNLQRYFFLHHNYWFLFIIKLWLYSIHLVWNNFWYCDQISNDHPFTAGILQNFVLSRIEWAILSLFEIQ